MAFLLLSMVKDEMLFTIHFIALVGNATSTTLQSTQTWPISIFIWDYFLCYLLRSTQLTSFAGKGSYNSDGAHPHDIACGPHLNCQQNVVSNSITITHSEKTNLGKINLQQLLFGKARRCIPHKNKPFCMILMVILKFQKRFSKP